MMTYRLEKEGGYLTSILAELKKKCPTYNFEVEEYFQLRSWAKERDPQKALKLFSELFLSKIGKGAFALDIKLGKGGNVHAITLWGAEVKDGVCTKLYVTDTDDQTQKNSYYRFPYTALRCYDLIANESTHSIGLRNLSGSNSVIPYCELVKLYFIPAPLSSDAKVTTGIKPVWY